MGSHALLLENVSIEEAEVVMSLAHHERRQPGECFFRQGERVEQFLLLTSGHVKLTSLTPDGHEIALRLVGPGGHFGVIDGLGHSTYALTAEAVEPCDALAWESATMRRMLEANGTLALNMARALADRLGELQQRYCQLMTEPVDRRVARALLRLVRAAGRTGQAGIEVVFPVSRQDLGNMAGASLFTVSRLLHAWELAGIVRSGRRRIVLTKPQALVDLAEGVSV